MRLPFWPRRTLDLPTTLGPHQAIDALDRALRANEWDKERREGVLRFSLSCWLNSNGGRSIAHATAVSAPHGANVRVSLRIPLFNAILSAVWMLGASLGAVAATAAAVVRGDPNLLVMWAMPLFGLAMIAASFEPEARRIERTCRDALPPPPEPPPGPRGPFR